MNQLTKVFEEQDLTIIEVEGDFHFLLKDVCEILEIGQVAGVSRRLDKDVISKHTLQTAGGKQQATFVNEDGLYDVILDSRKPEAKRFRKWITSEVLPSIRKHGAYMTNSVIQEIQSNPEVINFLAEQVAKIHQANADYHERANEKLETIEKRIEGEYVTPQDLDAINYAIKFKAEKFVDDAGVQITIDSVLVGDIYEQAKASKKAKEQRKYDIGKYKRAILVALKKHLGMKGNAKNNHIRRKDVDKAIEFIKNVKQKELA